MRNIRKIGIALLLSFTTVLPVIPFVSATSYAAMADGMSAGMTAEQKYMYLKEAGIFEGDTNGVPNLDQNMTRAQLAAIITRVWGKSANPATSAVYEDMNEAPWAAGYIGAATESGLMNGTEPNRFSPSANTTLEQLAVVLARGFYLELSPPKSYELNGKLSEWSKDYVYAAVRYGMVEAKEDYTIAARRSDLVEFAYSAFIKNKQNTQSACPPAPENIAKENIAGEFTKLVSTAKESCELTKFADHYISQVNQTLAVTMFHILEQYLQKHESVVNSDFNGFRTKLKLDESYFGSSPFDVNLIMDPDLKQWMSNKLAGKYKLTYSEGGSYYISVDYEALKAYSPYLSDDLNAYLNIKANEYDLYTLPDLTRQAAELTTIEQYLGRSTQVVNKDKVKLIYAKYMRLYLMGGKYVSNFDDSYKLSEQAKLSFEQMIQNEPDSFNGRIVQEFLSVLKNNDYRIAVSNSEGYKPVIQQFLDSVKNRIEQM